MAPGHLLIKCQDFFMQALGNYGAKQGCWPPELQITVLYRGARNSCDSEDFVHLRFTWCLSIKKSPWAYWYLIHVVMAEFDRPG